MVQTSDEQSIEPNIPRLLPRQTIVPSPSRHANPTTPSRQSFSWPVYALAAVLFLIANATSVAALPSPVSPLNAFARRATATAADATGTCACQVETSKKHTALFAVEGQSLPSLLFTSRDASY